MWLSTSRWRYVKCPSMVTDYLQVTEDIVRVIERCVDECHHCPYLVGTSGPRAKRGWMDEVTTRRIKAVYQYRRKS